MAGVNPAIELVKVPVPVPSDVFESAIVGLAILLQQVPLAITGVVPSVITVPPADAVVADVAVTVELVIRFVFLSPAIQGF